MYDDDLYSFVTCQKQHDLERLEKALELERSPEGRSNLAYCKARLGKSFDEAIPLVREAIDRDPSNPLHYLNYGRILYMSGDTKSAIETYRKGLEYGLHFEFLKELELIGLQGPHIIRKIPKKHFINRCLGRILTKLKLR